MWASTRHVLTTGLDAILSEKLVEATADDSYTILFISTPGEPTTYEADFTEPVQMDLKRNVNNGAVRRQGNETDWNKLPLFEKYQFFTPGKIARSRRATTE